MRSPIVNMLIVVLLVIGAFAMGSMYTKIQFLEGKSALPQALGTQTAAAPTQNPSAAPSAPPTPTTVKVNITANDPMKGDPKAKVTVVEYADYQCPFCGGFFKDTEPQLLKDYVDTGKVKFVYKNLAFLGQESHDAANAALCAKEQNKFWEFHDYLFGHQQGENQGAFSVVNLKKFASDLGLDTTAFNSCLDANKYNSQVQADIAEANQNGFNSTPSFAIDSSPMIGAQPYTQFKTAIDAELAKK